MTQMTQITQMTQTGPFNSWGRQLYITTVGDGVTASITPAVTEISHNFIVSNYHGHEAIDNDDASEYFNTHHNFFVYGANGLKSDFSGHDNRHHNNLYAYVAGACFGIGSFVDGCVAARRRGERHRSDAFVSDPPASLACVPVCIAVVHWCASMWCIGVHWCGALVWCITCVACGTLPWCIAGMAPKELHAH
jgi:hypothetical protein